MHILNMDAERGGRTSGGTGGESGVECCVEVKEGDDRPKVCRICHFGKKDIIPLGCDCKGELGSSHRHCADVWFAQKGDKVCEICGKTAKNVGNNEEAEMETSIFMMEWNEMREAAASLDVSGEGRRRCWQCFCHWVLGCFILLFMLLWFFRGIKAL